MSDTIALKQRASYFPAVDIFKLICALLVVMIHCLEIRNGHPIAAGIVDILSGQAVPFFMIASGFFLGNKISKATDPLKTALKSAKSWLLIYLAWTVIWTPYFLDMYAERYPDKSIFFLGAMLLRRYLLAGQGVYWYLLILAEAAVLLGVCVKYKKINLFYIIGIMGLVLGFVYDIPVIAPGTEQLNHLFYVVFSWSNNIVMKGIPYVAIGYFISTYLASVDRLTLRSYLVVYAVVILLSLFVYDGTPKMMHVSYPIKATVLMLIAIKINAVHVSELLSSTCRNMSTVIYYLHTLLIYFIVDPLFGVDSPILLKFSMAVIGSVLIYLFAVKVNWKPINWLLSVRLPQKLSF